MAAEAAAAADGSARAQKARPRRPFSQNNTTRAEMPAPAGIFLLAAGRDREGSESGILRGAEILLKKIKQKTRNAKVGLDTGGGML